MVLYVQPLWVSHLFPPTMSLSSRGPHTHRQIHGTNHWGTEDLCLHRVFRKSTKQKRHFPSVCLASLESCRWSVSIGLPACHLVTFFWSQSPDFPWGVISPFLLGHVIGCDFSHPWLRGNTRSQLGHSGHHLPQTQCWFRDGMCCKPGQWKPLGRNSENLAGAAREKVLSFLWDGWGHKLKLWQPSATRGRACLRSEQSQRKQSWEVEREKLGFNHIIWALDQALLCLCSYMSKKFCYL